MQNFRTAFFILMLLINSSSVFAFGSAGADCDGDGINDINCTGSSCIAKDSMPNKPGYCECWTSPTMDRKSCSDEPSFSPVSFFEGDELWQQLVPLESEGCERQEPESAESRSAGNAKDTA